MAIVMLMGYLDTFSRFFVSEDFFTLRFLSNHPFWETFWSHLTGPVLGINVILFYRPVSFAFLHIEYLAWGVNPLPYMLVHFLIHAINVLLVFLVMRNLMRTQPVWYAIVASLVFAIYPLNLNAVSFIAASPAVLCTTFLLGAFLAYQHYEAGGRHVHLIASAASFCLSLGCYEFAAMFPLIVIAVRVLRTGLDEKPLSRNDFLGWSVLLAILVAYLIVRYLSLGEMVGGYQNSGSPIFSRSVSALVYEFFTNFVHIIHPNWVFAVPGWLAWGVGFVMTGTFLLSVFRFRDNPLAVLFTCGVAWTVIGQLPFLFNDITPATGRYWYLPSIGLGLLIVVSVAWLSQVISVWLPRVRPSALTSVLLLIIVAYYFGLLRYYADEYALAGERSRQIQKGLADIVNATDAPVFVRGHPMHHRLRNGVPVAQVFQWGLSDSVLPPFLSSSNHVYPLLNREKGDPFPVSGLVANAQLWEWDDRQGQFSRVHTDHAIETGDLKHIDLLPANTREVRIIAEPGIHYQLVISGAANNWWSRIKGRSKTDRSILVEFPERFIDSVTHLYAGDIYFWIEGRDRNKRLHSVSEARRLPHVN